ncbi:hypothetical protein IFM12275_11260 [Nocardia sputorum]|nr:hypothetical protein IFM12275_11260 [Nocardia sputorum]
MSWSGVLFAVAVGAGLLLLGEDMRAAQWLGIGLVILACAGSARGSRNDGAVGGAEMAVSSAVDKVTQVFPMSLWRTCFRRHCRQAS